MAESRRSRWGIPDLAGRRPFVSAASIDSIGTGLILTLVIVYFDLTTDVPLAAIGASMTLARLLALPTSVVVGPLLDRFGGRHVAAAGNAVSAVGYLGFLLVQHSWQIVVVVFLVQIGHTTYWTSSGTLVVLAAPEDQRTRWFSFVYTIRNTGMGVGAALGAFAFSLGAQDGLRLIAAGNAVSYLVAAALLAGWRPPAAAAPAAEPEPEQPREVPQPSYRTVLTDRRYGLLMATNVTFVFAQMLLKILLALYIVDGLHQSARIAGILLVAATVQVSLTQTLCNRRAERHPPTRVIAASALITALSFLVFAVLRATPGTVAVAGLFVAMAVFTLGEVIGFPALDTLSVSLAPDHVRGRYLAVYQLSWTVGEVCAPALLTALFDRSAVLPLLFLMALNLLAVPLVLRLERLVADRASPRRAAAHLA